MTFGLELHAWRWERSSDLFYVYIRLGFFTLAYSKLLVSEALERIADKMSEEEDRDSLGELPPIPTGGHC